MKPLNISIPKPCHENWDAMTPEDKGRFCGLCQKTVVDFTGMDNAGVADFFERHKGQKVCGRFRNGQLTPPEMPLLSPALVNRIARRPLSSIQMFALALLVCMGTTLFSCNKSKGEPAVEQETEHTTGAPMVGGGAEDTTAIYDADTKKKPKIAKEETVEEVGISPELITVGMVAPELHEDVNRVPFTGSPGVDSLQNKGKAQEPPHLMGDTIAAPKP